MYFSNVDAPPVNIDQVDFSSFPEFLQPGARRAATCEAALIASRFLSRMDRIHSIIDRMIKNKLIQVLTPRE